MSIIFKKPCIAKAFEFCVVAHKGQKYGTLPYYTHCLAVAENVIEPTENEIIAALLHDTVEDTDVTLGTILNTFGPEIYDIVKLLTKDVSLSYMENINRIVRSGNVSALKIKWTDNYVNMSGDKSHMNYIRREKLNERYSESFLVLSKLLGY